METREQAKKEILRLTFGKAKHLKKLILAGEGQVGKMTHPTIERELAQRLEIARAMLAEAEGSGQ